jgi:hypothetical protein
VQRRCRLSLELRTDIDASGNVLLTWKLGAGVQLPHRLADALEGGRDADGGQRYLDEHRAGPDTAEAQRGSTAAHVRQVAVVAAFA